MATKSFILKDGVLLLNPQGSVPTSTEKGDIYVDSADGLPVIVRTDGTNGEKLVTVSATQTLTNKTLTSPVINSPTGITKADVGLGNVDNTSDLNKPISTATQAALDTKQPLDSDLTAIAALSPSNDDIIQRKAGAWTNRTPAQYKVDLNLTKSDIGLGNVDNTSDATKNAAVATLTNKTIVEPVIDNYMDINEESAPSTPASGKIRIYAKTDGNLYYKDDTGTEYLIETENADEIQLVARPGTDYSGNTNILIPQFPWEDPQLVDIIDTDPTGTGYDAKWSPNGEFLAVAQNSSPYINIYQKQGLSLTKLANPGTIPAASAFCVAWSPNGEFLAVGHGYSTRSLSIYQRSGSTFTKLTDGASWPTDTVYSLSWSPNGEYLACAHGNSPYLSVYRRSGTTFTILTAPASPPTATGRAVRFSPGGTRIWFLQSTTGLTDELRQYSYSSTAIGTLTNSFDGYAPGAFSDIAMHPDSYQMAVAPGEGLGRVDIYTRSGSTWTLNQTLNAGSGATTANRCVYSLNGKYLAVGSSGNNYVYIYEIDGTTYTLMTTLPSIPTGPIYGLDFSQDNQMFAFGTTNSPYVATYQTNGEMPEIGLGKVIGYYKAGTLQ
jgi:WD40 repeat protein